MHRGNIQWIPPPQVKVGDVKGIKLTNGDGPFILLTQFSADRICACNWQKVEDMPYVLFKEVFTGIRAKDKALYLRYSKAFMGRLLSQIGVTDVELCQYHVTFGGKTGDKLSGEYISKYQIPHRCSIPKEIGKSGNDWYVFSYI